MFTPISFKVTGATPLLMQSIRMANPLDPIVKKLKELQSNRTKTDDTIMEISNLQWQGHLYLGVDKMPAIPAENWEAMLLEAAKTMKLGKKFERGCMVEKEAKLQYPGMRKPEAMLLDPACRLVVMARNKAQGTAVLSTRPIFPEWSCKVTVSYHSGLLNDDEVDRVMRYGGEFISICAWRRRYGRFAVERIN